MADERFSRSAGRAETAMTAVVLLVSVRRTTLGCKVAGPGSRPRERLSRPGQRPGAVGSMKVPSARSVSIAGSMGAGLPVVIPSLPCDPRRSYRMSA